VTLQVFTRDRDTHLHVIDHGVGIPDADKSMVLRPFHRLGDSSHTAGVGLGLAIADRLIAAMNGRLELRDTPGGGLTVAIVLPCAEEIL
jgi:two-component system sensor histidine kinase KdpD